jgi:SAM-dependent methyltransferase
MQRLTKKEYWDAKHELSAAAGVSQTSSGGRNALIERALGPRVVEYLRDYCDYLLWDVVYEKHLPRAKGARALEVGSAPGEHLVRLWTKFGYEPYGIEYSERGVDVNRRLFRYHGINAANVIHGDFFSPAFQDEYRGHFDIVLSRGFVEHFSNPEATIDAHLNVLRDGGHLVVTIPNLQGMNYLLTRFFYKELLPLHNLTMMRREAFHRLFTQERLLTLTCQYYGTFNFGLFFTKPDSHKRHLLPLGAKVQRLMNIVFRTVLGDAGAEHRYFSPYLLFIGVKKR